MLPSLWPTNKSKSLSLSISTKVGIANPFTIMSLRGLSEFSKKIYFGLKLVPVFWKNLIVPSWHPIKRSLSASLSMSIKKGVENKPTSIPSEIESILLKTKLLSFLKVYLP